MVQSSDSKCHTDRPVLHKRMACWLHLSLCKYVFGISSSSGSRNSTSSVAVLSSLHCTWSMCFIIVDSIVAAVVAGDMGAIAGAVPAKEKGGRPHPCDCRGFMYKFGAVRDCVHGGSVRYTLHHLLVEAWSAYEQASSTEKAMVLAFAGEKLVLPAMGPRLAWEKQVPGFPQWPC